MLFSSVRCDTFSRRSSRPIKTRTLSYRYRFYTVFPIAIVVVVVVQRDERGGRLAGSDSRHRCLIFVRIDAGTKDGDFEIREARISRVIARGKRITRRRII